MRNLLKNEIYRLTKEKSSLVLLILAVAIPFFTVGMVVLVARLAENMDPTISIAPPFSSIFTADFSSNNTILMIFFIIMIVGNSRDFSYGTIRNKIIAGYKRTHIYFAKQIITIAFALILVVVYLLSDILFYSIFLGFETEIISNPFLYYLELFIIGLLTILVAVSFAQLLSTLFIKTGKTILMYFVFMLVYELIVETIISSFIIQNDYEMIEQIYELQSWFPDVQATIYSTGDTSNNLLLKTVITSIVCIVGFNYFAINSLKRKEIK